MTSTTKKLIERQKQTSKESKYYLSLSLKGIKYIPYDEKSK